MSQFTPLIAFDVGTLLSIVVFVIVVVSSIISQMLAKQREQQQVERRPRREPRQGGPMDEMQAGVPQQGRPQGQKPAALEDEISDFLRRAARSGGQQRPAQARPAQQAPPQQTRPQPPPRPVQTRPKPNRPTRPRAPVPRRAQPPLAAEIVEPGRAPLSQSLSEQVSRDVNTSEITRHTSQLGEETRQASTKLNQQIHDKFDHKLGNLGHDMAVPSEGTQAPLLPVTSAAGLGALLSDAESLKQAIILNEILQRPAHRW